MFALDLCETFESREVRKRHIHSLIVKEGVDDNGIHVKL